MGCFICVGNKVNELNVFYCQLSNRNWALMSHWIVLHLSGLKGLQPIHQKYLWGEFLHHPQSLKPHPPLIWTLPCLGETPGSSSFSLLSFSKSFSFLCLLYFDNPDLSQVHAGLAAHVEKILNSYVVIHEQPILSEVPFKCPLHRHGLCPGAYSVVPWLESCRLYFRSSGPASILLDKQHWLEMMLTILPTSFRKDRVQILTKIQSDFFVGSQSGFHLQTILAGARKYCISSCCGTKVRQSSWTCIWKLSAFPSKICHRGSMFVFHRNELHCTKPPLWVEQWTRTAQKLILLGLWEE